jgi:NTP pyrophosphatase (non-canonical NTP hydrolase)
MLKAYEKFVDEFWFYDPSEHADMPEAEYVTLAIFGETGEIAEKIKKYFRGDTKFTLNTEEISNEIGDVLYYLIKLSHVIDYTIDWKQVSDHIQDHKLKLSYTTLELCGKVGLLAASDTDSVMFMLTSINDRLFWALVWLGNFANSCDTSLMKASEANVAKLNSRRERGKMRGEGDNR